MPYANAEILVFDGNFHGRTTTIVGFSSEEDYRFGFGPFTPGFRILPYGDLQAVADAITPNTAAVLIEPIQGEGGIIVPPEGFLRQLRELTAENKVLLMTDEIQSGLGRTGRLFCFEHEGIRPDVVIIGKALSGGLYPVSAVLADDEVMNVFKPGQHGSTFGGNPLAAAIARTALKVLVEEGMIENSATLGEHMMERLRAIDSPHIKEVRWSRPVGRHRARPGSRRGSPCVRAPADQGAAVQGHPRARDPPGATAGDHPRGAGLGDGRHHRGVRCALISEALTNHLAHALRGPFLSGHDDRSRAVRWYSVEPVMLVPHSSPSAAR